MDVGFYDEGPFSLQKWLTWEYKSGRMPAYLLKEMPDTVEGQAKQFLEASEHLAQGNRFALSRALFNPNIAASVRYVFDRFFPGGCIDAFEVGPGYDAVSTSYLPLDKIAKLTLMEVSEASCENLRPDADMLGWNLIHDDFHISHHLKPNSQDLFYSSSSADGTRFLDRFFHKAHYIIKRGGYAFIFQDVFPDLMTVLWLEYNKRGLQGKFNGNIPYGITEEGNLLWVADSTGLKIPSHLYLQDMQAEAARNAGFSIEFKGVVRSDDIRGINLANFADYNHAVGHLQYDFKNDATLLQGIARFTYHMNLLVLKKK